MLNCWQHITTKQFSFPTTSFAQRTNILLALKSAEDRRCQSQSILPATCNNGEADLVSNPCYKNKIVTSVSPVSHKWNACVWSSQVEDRVKQWALLRCNSKPWLDIMAPVFYYLNVLFLILFFSCEQYKRLFSLAVQGINLKKKCDTTSGTRVSSSLSVWFLTCFHFYINLGSAITCK